MIEGFEDFTKDITLSDRYDLELVNLISKGLRARVGKENKITNIEMREKLLDNKGKKINGAKMRRCIQYIRANQLVPMLCASKGGYYVAEDREEWVKYKESFRSRIRSMQFTMACMDLSPSINNAINNQK